MRQALGYDGLLGNPRIDDPATFDMNTRRHTQQCGTMTASYKEEAPRSWYLHEAEPNPVLEDPAMTDSIGPTLATVSEPTPPAPAPVDYTNRCARDVRRLTGHLVAEELDDLVANLTGEQDGGRVDPVQAELIRETAHSLDRFIRQGRLPRRADLYSFRAIAALAGAAGYRDGELVAVVEACADAVCNLWRVHARNLATLYGNRAEHGAPATEKAAELVSEVTRLFLRKLPGQLRIGLAIAATTTHQRVLTTA